jgi:hypothetical protein
MTQPSKHTHSHLVFAQPYSARVSIAGPLRLLQSFHSIMYTFRIVCSDSVHTWIRFLQTHLPFVGRLTFRSPGHNRQIGVGSRMFSVSSHVWSVYLCDERK